MMNKNIQVTSFAGLHIAFSVFLFLASCLLPIAAFSQNWAMRVDGRVYANKVKLAGSIVTLYKNGVQEKQVITEADGAFFFKLPLNAEYIVTVTKPGFITKKLKILTTNVPTGRADTVKFKPFQPNFTIFEMPIDPETSKRMEAILSQPLAVYQYILSEKNFDYDEKYTDMIKARLSELEELQKKAENEMVDKAKTAAMEAEKQMELDKNYNAAINRADKAFGGRDYINAKAGYKEASGLKPEEAYPLQKIAEIDKLLVNGNK
jgi:hypothetical protein